jgi:predicted nucleotidyltransferase
MLSSVELHGGDTGSRMSSNAGERQSGVADVTTSRQATCLDNSVIAEHLEAIRALCREFGVARLEVFGSVCTPHFDPERSDVDFLVVYPPDYDYGPWLSKHLFLEERLSHLLGRKVDLVMIDAAQNMWFQREADKTRTVVFDGSKVAEVA